MNTSIYILEVIDAHVEIEQWFSGAAETEKLASLLARFSPRFSMVSPKGATLAYEDVAAMFRSSHGARPGLRIQVDDWRTVQEWEDGAVVSYRETQVLENGDGNVRQSIAVFVRNADGVVRWVHLHETFA